MKVTLAVNLYAMRLKILKNSYRLRVMYALCMRVPALLENTIPIKAGCRYLLHTNTGCLVYLNTAFKIRFM